MAYSFYNSSDYKKKKQGEITRQKWAAGTFNFHYKRERRSCARNACKETFEVIQSEVKKYCSQSCAAKVNNSKRRWPEEVKRKIARSNTGKRYTRQKGKNKVHQYCHNSQCGKLFWYERWKRRQYCSSNCAIKAVGQRVTSPRAARGKAGIRPDISNTIYFYSRWEANVARLYTLLGKQWQYAPQTFDIGGQHYTPDFYLPDEDMYVEVKNFWGVYSKRRHEKFKARYPQMKLEVILKDSYLKLQEKYSKYIPHWEYKNSDTSHIKM